MPLSCDHKAVFDGNRGPNTGGMGVYSPPWWASPTLQSEVSTQVTEPIARALAAEGHVFRGILYPGVFAGDVSPQVFECNARFGDPETQALLVRLQSDLLEIVEACVRGTLDQVDVRWSSDASVCVVLASGGYPGSYSTGLPITGVGEVGPGVVVFHAGTRRDAQGQLVTAELGLRCGAAVRGHGPFDAPGCITTALFAKRPSYGPDGAPVERHVEARSAGSVIGSAR